jgi:hypothetical protein
MKFNNLSKWLLWWPKTPAPNLFRVIGGHATWHALFPPLYGRVFFFSILCCSSSELLYIKWFRQVWLQTRYESRPKYRILLYSWLPTGTYHTNLVIWKKRIWAIFSMENPLYMLKSYFSGRNLAKFCPQKNTAVWGRISEYQKSTPVKKLSVLWGTPISHSLWISGNFPGVGGDYM